MQIGPWCGSDSGAQLKLYPALIFDGIVSHQNGLSQVLFRTFFGFAFHHHHILEGSGHHQIHIGHFKRAARRVDDKFPVDTGHPHFGNRTVERDVGNRKGCRSGQASQSIGQNLSVGTKQGYLNLGVSMVILRKQRTESPVDQPANQNFVIRQTSFATLKTARDFACRGKFFLVIHREGHKVDVFFGFFGRNDRGQKPGIPHANKNSAVGLTGHESGFDGNDPTVG